MLQQSSLQKKTLEEHGSKVSEDIKKSIEEALQELKDIVAKDDADIEDLKTKRENLITVSQKLGEAMYSQQQSSDSDNDNASQESSSGSDSKKDDDNVVDSEFEEVDDTKK